MNHTVVHNLDLKFNMQNHKFAGTQTRLSFIPSSPQLFPRAWEAMSWGHVSHRTPEFQTLCKQTLSRLGKLMPSAHLKPIITAGNGTLANDLMLSYMAKECSRPLVLSNGEFGQRLFAQCKRHFNTCSMMEAGWGAPLDLSQVRSAIQEDKPDSLVFTAVETSTGMTIPVEALSSIAEEFDLAIGIDGVSALGNVRQDFSSKAIVCVSSTSGKAIASLAGIAILYVREEQNRTPEHALTPLSLDVNSLLRGRNSPGMVRNTLSSVLLATLHESLEHIFVDGLESHFAHYNNLKNAVLRNAEKHNLEVCSGGDCPCVTTIRIPTNVDWKKVVGQIHNDGFELYHDIEYLKKHDVFQIATFGNYSTEEIDDLFDSLGRARRSSTTFMNAHRQQL